MSATTQRTHHADATREHLQHGTSFAVGEEGAREHGQQAHIGERTEPRWNETATSRPSPRAGQALGQEPWQMPVQDGERKRHATRFWVMGGIFAVGAIVGLGAALWLDNSQTRTRAPDASTMPSTVKPSAQTVQSNRPRMRGISPDELPYDGAPPSEHATQQAAVPVPPAPPAGDSVRIPAPVASGATPPTSAPDAARPEAPADTSPARIAAAPGNDARSESTSGSSSSRPKVHRKAAEKKTAKTSSRRHLAQDSVKDKEIERIRQQAEEELKKKTNAGHAVKEARAGKGRAGGSGSASGRENRSASLASRTATTRAMLARCERIDGLIDREKCKWRVCGGRWGQHGCPSYAVHTPLY
ncbi:MAG TPA: hypothetical protein VJ698_10505 [Noviherbaspirillum sp.]|uniref:hypothetical protein n=1 Tax=Noviherbaspirillum sp. TaxID=1926288 RepID=UPI002B467E63|nr:hypothetical protein [Noviherbaspirillum sp.]HJV85896.1 hypothetical protein [Noviherbaspirillum sp.]